MRVAITHPHYEDYRIHLDALGPDRSRRWRELEISWNPSGGDFDAWVVMQSMRPLPAGLDIRCPRGRTVLLSYEPPDILSLLSGYTRQFACAFVPDHRVRTRGARLATPGVVWHVECDHAFLSAATVPEKTGLLSAVTSALRSTDGHRQRLALLEAVKERFGTDLTHYGRGFNPTRSKWDAIHPFRYHLTLENGRWPHYWTEKLADAFLGHALPLYVGCPEVAEYFPADAVVALDPDDHDGSIALIERLISEDAWSRRLDSIRAARHLVLEKHQLLPFLHALLPSLPDGPCRPARIRPHTEFTPSLVRRIRQRLDLW